MFLISTSHGINLRIFAFIMDILITIICLLSLGMGFLAVTQNTLIGKARNSVGGTTFSKWKNLNVLKSKANPHNPRTQKQTANRINFKLALLTFRRALPDGYDGFPSKLSKLTTENVLMQANVGKSFVRNLTPPYTPVVTFTAIVWASGSIDNILTPTLLNNTIAGFQVGWIDNTNGTTAEASDTASVMIMNTVTTIVGTKEYYESFYISQGDLRSGTTLTKSLPAIWAGRTVAIYIFMKRDSTLTTPRKSSDSSWFFTGGLI